jgi:hypothetical protein
MHTKKFFRFVQILAKIFWVGKTSREQKILLKLLLKNYNFLNYIKKKVTYLQNFLIDQTQIFKLLENMNLFQFFRTTTCKAEENEFFMIILLSLREKKYFVSIQVQHTAGFF